MAKFIDKVFVVDNVVDIIGEDLQNALIDRVLADYNNDLSSHSDFCRNAKKYLDLAKMEEEVKDDPWPNAANIKYPMIATAVMQFTANTVSEIIRNEEIAKTAILGKDNYDVKARKAGRVRNHLNYLLLQKNHNFENSLDRTLTLSGTIGHAFKKGYYDSATGDICTELCMYDEVVVKKNIQSLQSARSITHKLKLHANTIVERQRLGEFAELDNVDLMIDSPNSDDAYHDVLEQHCWFDLDKDGYEEPWIVTIHEDSRQILRVSPRFEKKNIKTDETGKVMSITADLYFVDYGCMPAFDGSYFCIGFGSLLYVMNKVTNTSLNQLTDAATLANLPVLLIGGALDLKSGAMKLKPGTMMKIDTLDQNIRNSVYELGFKEPSTTLFNLTQFLVTTSKEVASTTDMMTGNQQAQNAPATTVLSLLEKGMKVYSAIYKRIIRSVTDELRIIHRLVRLYGDPAEYYRVVDDPEANFIADFNDDDIDVLPVADPILSSEAQRLALAEATLQAAANFPDVVDRKSAVLSYFTSIGIKNMEQLVPENKQQPPDPKMVELQMKQQIEMAKLENEKQALANDAMRLQLDMQKWQTDTQIKATKLQQSDRKIQNQEQAQSLDLVKHTSTLEAQAAMEEYKGQVKIATEEIKANAKQGDKSAD